MWDLNVINQMKNYAELNNVPIMTDSGMNYLLKYLLYKGLNNKFSLP